MTNTMFSLRFPQFKNSNMMTQTEPAYKAPEQVIVLEQTPQLLSLMTIIRDKTTGRGDFVFYSDRIIRLLVEEALNYLPTIDKTVVTNTQTEFKGQTFLGKICGVSIMRAGESMEQGLRDCCR